MNIEDLEFTGTWREYQARVLTDLNSHLDDKRLHVVAAPGSGKTILGLETVRRLAAPALILAPSLTIRNQWIDRLVAMFTKQGKAKPDWISTDVRHPKRLTVSTYQALHAAVSGSKTSEADLFAEEEDESSDRQATESTDVVALLNAQGVKTIVLDEAHHLRKAWWKVLIGLKTGLEDATFVSLTATPPYDVDPSEWRRYEDLCGPIDSEIPVPELVKRGDLCPHQDYIYFSLPAQHETMEIERFRTAISGFVQSLLHSGTFVNLLGEHPWVADPQSQIEEILAEPRFFSSVIIFLHAAGFETPKRVLNILGARRSDIPELTPEWLEELLSGVLYSQAEYFEDYAEFLNGLRRDLKRIGAIERRKVLISSPKDIQKLLAGSLSKLDSIVEITKAETEALGDDLRMVVLTDYIRKAALPNAPGDISPVAKIGVVPIFEHLRRAEISGTSLGILTGSLVIIPVSARDMLERQALELGIDRIRFVRLAHDSTYVRVEIDGAQKQRTVELITRLFNAGGVNVLVGTAALLGEGWDAPTVNTLILASYVGSYMLSNQMRGRAIRIDPNRPNKVANIWHLCAIDLHSPNEDIRSLAQRLYVRQPPHHSLRERKQDLGHDFKVLERRFRAFEGVSVSSPPIIETGIKRLELPDTKWTEGTTADMSRSMIEKAKSRNRLRALWNAALDSASPSPEMRETVVSNYVPRPLVFANTIKYLVVNALIMGAALGARAIEGIQRSGQTAILIGLGVAAIVAVPGLVRAGWLTFRHGSLEGSIRQVGWAVLETLQHMAVIKTHSDKLKVHAVQDDMGVVHCRLEGATRIEKKIFNDAMQAALGPTDNPRYLLMRTSLFGWFRRVDFHPVPDLIGKKKESAEFYAKRWNRYVGPSKLIYTRTQEGRLTLLNARTQSLAGSFRKKTDQLSIWE